VNPADLDMNKKAYEKVESPETFANFEEVLSYRQNRIKNAEHLTNFILHLMNEKIRLLDICSGNSALSYCLLSKGELDFSDNLELSDSRHIFAETWKKDLEASCVTNFLTDAMQFGQKRGKYNVITLVDSAINYLALNENFQEWLQDLEQCLNSNGILIIEYVHYRKIFEIMDILQGSYRTFFLDEGNRFDVRLYEFNRSSEDHLEAKSTYINSLSGKRAEKIEIQKILSADQVKKLFKGLKLIEERASFSDDKANDKTILVFRK
jgi:hypothetical protein